MDNMNTSCFPLALAALKSAKSANERIDNLPLPMVFKGTLGTGGTISTLPTASTENEGYVYIVITDGTYAGQSAKAGDTFVSDGSSWVLVPSADEPSVIDDSVTSTALTWSSSKLKRVVVKTFTYTGNGESDCVITFPETPSFILSLTGNAHVEYQLTAIPFIWGCPVIMGFTAAPSSTTNAARIATATYNDNSITITSTGANTSYNTNNKEFTVIYI